MKKTMVILLAGLMICLAACVSAAAQPISFTGIAPEIPAHSLSGGETVIESGILQLLGTNEKGQYLVFADGEYYAVEPAELESTLPGVDLSGLPEAGSYSLVVRYQQNEAILEMQRDLVQLGYLTSEPDGDFGSRTENAIKGFQAAMGLEETGQGDPLLQMLLSSMTDEITVISSDPREVFAVLGEDLPLDPELLYESGFGMEYDDIEGTGLIWDGSSVRVDASGSSDIDQNVFTLRVGLYVWEDEEGRIAMAPALLVDCLCVRRPMMENVILKSGSLRLSADAASLKSSISGVSTVESALFLLDGTGPALLSGAETNGELKIRLKGANQSFDFVIPEQSLPGISRVGEIASQIK